MRNRFSAFAAVIFGLAAAAQASTVNILANGSNTETVVGITGFTATGATMGTNNSGTSTMTVIVNGGSPVSWVAGGVTGCLSANGCGSASGTLPNGGTWTLVETGDSGAVFDAFNPDTTALNSWVLTDNCTGGCTAPTAVTSVVLVGGLTALGLHGIVFDRDLGSGGQTGTPASALGIDYSIVGHSFDGTKDGRTLIANVTYDKEVFLFSSFPCQGSFFAGKTTTTPCGDEWGQVGFAFSGATQFIPSSTGTSISWTFFQDTDFVGTPEPLSLGLGGIGLLALAVYRKRRSSRLPDRA